MADQTDEFAVAPLSERDHPNAIERSYDDVKVRREERIAGDLALLAALELACNPRRSTHWGQQPALAPGRKVRELPEDWVSEIVDDVLEDHVLWSLEGDESQPLLDRLDAHFRPLGEAWRRSRLEREEMLNRSAEQARADAAARAAAVDEANQRWAREILGIGSAA